MIGSMKASHRGGAFRLLPAQGPQGHVSEVHGAFVFSNKTYLKMQCFFELDLNAG